MSSYTKQYKTPTDAPTVPTDMTMAFASSPTIALNTILNLLMKGMMNMNIYLKNNEGEQTVRYLPVMKALWLRFIVFAKYPKKVRPIVRFMI